MEEDESGCGNCRDCNDAPDSSRSTKGTRVDGRLPVPPVLTHLSVALYIFKKNAGGTEVQEVIELLMGEELDLSDFRFYLQNIDQCVRISEDFAEQAVSKYFCLQDK